MFHISIWVAGAVFGGAKPTKVSRGDGAAGKTKSKRSIGFDF